MPLSGTWKAIGKVTELLRSRLQGGVQTLKDEHGNELTLTVSVGRPEPPDTVVNDDKNRLNIFLYEAPFDGNIHNISADVKDPEPIWMVLKYILTPFDENGESDTSKALEYLGAGIQVLQKMNFLDFKDIDYPEHKYSPEYLQITFEQATSDLISKIMQGSDEKYRCSVAFQVRPVMIAPGEEPVFPPLVGIDYTETTAEIIGDKGVQIPLIPNVAPTITNANPARVEAGEELEISGFNLDLSVLNGSLGAAKIPVISQHPDSLTCVVDSPEISLNVISAGNHPLRVCQTLTTGKIRSSNVIPVSLLPGLESVKLNPVSGGATTRDLVLEGKLLGGVKDDIRVALIRDGAVFRIFEDVGGDTEQVQLVIQVDSSESVAVIGCRAVLQVNGQEAKKRPVVEEGS